jgi:hypothetical protein
MYYTSPFLVNITFLVIWLLPFGLKAQEIITDRPDQTESSSTIPKNSFQLETGVVSGHVANESNRENVLLAPSTLVRYGLTKNFELRLANHFARTSSESLSLKDFGFTDLELGFKLQLLRKENVNTEIALLSHLVLPIGDVRLTNVSFGMVNKLSIAHNLGDIFTIGYNLGYNYFGFGSGTGTYSIALGAGLTKRIGFYIEPYGEWVDFNVFLSNLDGGFTYLLQPNMQIDVSYGLGLNYVMQYFSAGFSWNFTL